MKQPTTVHKELISEVRAEFFGYATSVVTDRAAAEKAAATIVDPALETYEVHWVASPMAGTSRWDSLRDSLRASLRDSLWASIRDSRWTAYWTCAVRITGHTGPDVERLQAFADFARSAFALWVLPGHVIICEKPTAVEVRDGKLIDIQWGGGEQ
jgi:hypothetical protein